MRISGLVRVARAAEDRLRAGVPAREREAFLTSVRERLDEAHHLLERHAAGPEDLPHPSRTALASLQRIACLSEEDVAASGAGHDRPAPVRVRNVVTSLTYCQQQLALGATPPHRVEDVRIAAEMAADGIGAACEAIGSAPAGLPARSRISYAMLCWLSEADHAARYAEQVDVALASLAAGLPEAERDRDRPVEVAFAPGRLLHRVSRVPAGTAWRVSAGFLGASGEAFRDLAHVARQRKHARPDVRERHEAFTRSEAFQRVPLELEWLADPQPFRPRGRAHDLDTLFNALDRHLLRGRVERPNLHWWSTLSRRVFGFHLPSRDLVCISAILDDPAIPSHVAEVVLYHECLHKLHAPEIRGGRRIVHTKALRAAERLHPRYRESEDWLDRLAR